MSQRKDLNTHKPWDKLNLKNRKKTVRDGSKEEIRTLLRFEADR